MRGIKDPGFALAFPLCLLLLVFRAWSRLRQPELWGEDAIFVSQALSNGFASLMIPMAGSYHSLQRFLCVVFVKLFPLAWLPRLEVAACLGITAAVFATIARKQYAWLIPSKEARLALALVFCLAAGLQEMLGNFPNINWILFFALAFIGLKDPRESVSRGEVAVAALVIASVGTFILLLPLFVWRVWVARSHGGRDRGSLAVLGISAAMLVHLLLIQDASPPMLGDHLAEMGGVLFRASIQSFVYQPWLGDQAAIELRDLNFLGRAARLVALLAVCFWTIRHWRSRRAQAILLFTISLMAWPVLCWLARPGLMGYFAGIPHLGFWSGHYSFPSAMGALLFWGMLIYPTSPRLRWGSCVFLLFMGLNSYFSVYRFSAPAYGEQHRWNAQVGQLVSAIRTGCPANLVVPTYPEGWGVVYANRSPRHCE